MVYSLLGYYFIVESKRNFVFVFVLGFAAAGHKKKLQDPFRIFKFFLVSSNDLLKSFLLIFVSY